MSRSKLPAQKKIDKSLRKKFLNSLASLLRVSKTEPKIPSYVFETEPIIRRPLFDRINLFDIASLSWPLRRAFRAIIQECTRKRWSIQARFELVCTKCGKEYQYKPPMQGGNYTCLAGGCGGELKPPSLDQFKIVDALIKKPNRDYNFDDLVRSTIWYDLSLDDFYWGIAFQRRPKEVKDEQTGQMRIVLEEGKVALEKMPKEVYVEDSRFIFPVADQFGHLGGYEWFCPECYGKVEGDQPVVSIMPDTPLMQQEQLKRCPRCKGLMEQTAYVQEINGVVTARFTKEEIVHGSSSRVLPSLFGNPKIITIWKIMQTILSMDDYNFEVYSEGKVGAMIGLPGYDQEEVDEINTNIEAEIKKLDKKDISTGRYERSKKIRTLMLGLKENQAPIRLQIMEDLKNMQSAEFYKMYLDGIAGVYGVTPEFVSTSEGGAGQMKLKIDVQNRTTTEQQQNIADLWNEEILPKFGVTDWILAFNPIEDRDELRAEQVVHTRAAAAFTFLQAGFQVNIGPDGKLVVTGEGHLREAEPAGSRATEAYRSMAGKPRYWMEGEPTRTTGEELMLGKEEVRIPISWYSTSQIRVWDRVYALNNDRDQVYVVVNGHEIEGTRTSAVNLNYAVASLMGEVLDYIESKIEGVPGYNKEDFKAGKDKIVLELRRDRNLATLVGLANYFDSVNLSSLAEKIDNLRMRLSQLSPSTFEVQGEPGTPTASGEMLEPLPEKNLITARAPFGIVDQEKTLYDALKRIQNWALEEVKSGKAKEKTIHEALVKAKQTIEYSYKKLVDKAAEHAAKRTKKEVGINPEELKRLEVYKENSLKDFERILRDSLKGEEHAREGSD